MAVYVRSVCDFSAYVPRVQWFADSIPYGVGCTNIAGPREPIYFAAQNAGKPLLFVGMESFAGGANGLAADPYCECTPGIAASDLNTVLTTRIGVYQPDIVMYAAGTNDIGVKGDDAATVAATISAGLDLIWFVRTSARFKIVLFTILKRLDAFDPVVQATNALLPAVVASKSYASSNTLIDIYNVVQDQRVGGGYHDVVHPNDAGDTQYGTYAYENGIAAAVLGARTR